MAKVQAASPEHIRKIQALRTQFEYFAATCVKIEGVEPGSVYNFILNRAQKYLLAAMYAMLAEKGFVRIIVVKGRQQGISTLIEMFFFWMAIFIANLKVCIISHEGDSAAALFQKVEFAHEMLDETIRPLKRAESRGKELVLKNFSRYIVLTAGSKESGRSQTAHCQHQSERAFFSDPDKIDAGAGQIVRQVKGTYVIKESTGNGMNHFQKETLDALAGKGVYRVVFIPWFWEPAYATKPPRDFERGIDEELLVELHGLTDAQLQWRRDKIVELKSLRKFKQEYPCTLDEAFQASGEAFYDSELITKARKSQIVSTFGAVIMGVDAGREGDRTVIVIRRGRQVTHIFKYDEMDTMRLAGIVAGFIDKFNVDKCFIDWGMGHGTIDRLHERKYRMQVEGVHFGGSADDSEIYLNKRAEMAFRFREWLTEDGEVRLPDDDDMAADIASMPQEKTTSNSRIKFPSKDEIKEKYGRSPDILDAILLTFAYYVAAPREEERFNAAYPTTVRNQRSSALSSRQRILDGDDTEGLAANRADDCLQPRRYK